MAISPTKETSPVINVNGNARIGVGMIGVMGQPEAVNDGIDFDGIDMVCSVMQSGGNVVPGTRADYEHIAERRIAGVAIEQVR
jgi:hypothetical protein